MRIFKCPICGNVVELIHEGGGTLVCCGQEMEEQVINSDENVFEKHIPMIEKNGRKVNVQVGSVIHPMLDNHYIEWIALASETGTYRHYLKPSEEPKAYFETDSDHFTIYAYCNVHGFYKKEY